MSRQTITATDVYTQNLEATGTVDAAALNVGGSPAAINPMTTAADLIVGGAAGVPTRLGKGADGQVLTVDPATHLLTWATPAAAASNFNEAQAGVLVNATSVGDAGGRADSFSGTSLGAQWTVEEGAGRVAVANSSLGITTANTHISQPFTPTGAFRVEARIKVRMDGVAASSISVGVRDSGTGDTGTGYTMGFGIGAGAMGAGDATGAAIAGATTISTFSAWAGIWFYMAISRDGANHWHFFASDDRCNWIDLTGTANPANFTVAKLYIRAKVLGSVDFVDVTL